MIFYIIKATIRPGHLDAFTAANAELMDFITTNEPHYAAYSFMNDDRTEVTYVNVFDDAEAMAMHQRLIADEGILDDLAPTFDTTSREIYGLLTPDLVQKAAGADGVFSGASAGTFDRHISTGD